jgi:hypothetical protein
MSYVGLYGNTLYFESFYDVTKRKQLTLKYQADPSTSDVKFDALLDLTTIKLPKLIEY